MNFPDLSTGVGTASAVLFFLQTHQPAWLLLAGLLGLSVGSFLNVVVYRLPLMFANAPNLPKVNLCFPRSFCPQCQHPIAVQDNLPVVGYVRLRGRCRNCQCSIGMRYPMVEGLTGGLCVVSAWLWGPSWVCLIGWMLIWIGMTLALMLWDKHAALRKAPEASSATKGWPH